MLKTIVDAIKSYKPGFYEYQCPICGHDHYTACEPEDKDIERLAKHIQDALGEKEQRSNGAESND